MAEAETSGSGDSEKTRGERWYKKPEKKPAESGEGAKPAGEGGDGGAEEKKPLTAAERHAQERTDIHKRQKKARDDMAALHETELADAAARHEKELAAAGEAGAPGAPADSGDGKWPADAGMGGAEERSAPAK